MSAAYSLHEPCLDPPQLAAVCTCETCKEGVYAGDDIVKFDGAVYHRECFENVSVVILCERFGATVSVAEYGGWNG